MSGSTAESEDGRANRGAQLSPEARELLAHLRHRVEGDGECYLKSRYVAEEVELSAKQVGSYMRRLQERDISLSIEQWGYTNGTTWRVRDEPDQPGRVSLDSSST